MTTLTERRNLAGDRYAAAVKELRDAWCALAALDQLTRSPSFGPQPDVIPLRHPTFAPDISGAFADGVPAAMRAATFDQ